MFFKKKVTHLFNAHNIKVFKNHSQQKFKKIFLIEFNGWAVIHVIFSYLINYYKKEKNCKIIAYETFDLINQTESSLYKRFLWKIGNKLSVKTFRLFRDMGTDEFIRPFYLKKNLKKSNHIINNFYLKKPSLKKLEELTINNIWIGDLIYDTYLKKFSKPTIDLNSDLFKIFFKKSLLFFFFWEEYFKENEIEGVCVCHSVYLSGIPLRIAHRKKLRCFSASNMNLLNLSKSIDYKKKYNGSDTIFDSFNDVFKKNSSQPKKNFLIEGKKILKQIIHGKKRIWYLPNKTYSNLRLKKKIKKNRTSVVIFAHNFVDSPHIYGNHFFPDFKEWFNFLSKIINKTNYNWYLKDHPVTNDVTKKEVNNFLKKNPKIKYLDKNFLNNNLVNLGVDYILTVYGSIASEAPYYGINVINATKNGPHKNYDFSINPKNLNEYRKLLFNLKIKKFKKKLDKLFFYHYAKNYIYRKNLFFSNPDKYFKFYKDKPLQFTNKFYEQWLNDFTIKKHRMIISKLKKFIESDDYIFIK